MKSVMKVGRVTLRGNWLSSLLVIGLAGLSLAAAHSAVAETLDPLIKTMTLKQKIGQLSQRDLSGVADVASLPEALKVSIRQGEVGSFLNVNSVAIANEIQRLSVEESAQGIPQLIARDVIHGFNTIFPIPLGQAASWNPELVEQGARIAAQEASAEGIRWTFAPMLDIARDPRWGRIAESFGEDPYLASLYAVASVKGYQGDDLSRPDSIAACAKHFLGYGAAEGGRDYNATYIPEPLLHNIYMKPFKAAIDAGSASVMAAFNDLNGVPASTNYPLLKTLLRDELGFDGVLVSDWNSITETIVHGTSTDAKEAAKLSIKAGLDMEMVSTSYADHIADLLASGQITLAQIDTMVSRVLTLKRKLGLFAQPYTPIQNQPRSLKPAYLEAAKRAAVESMVLLKNTQHLLPLSKQQKIALIGPLAHAPHDQMGTWVFDGDKRNSVTPLTHLRALMGDSQLRYQPGLPHSRSQDRSGFADAIAAATAADVIVFIGGEEAALSGEAHSRSDIRLPGAQQALIAALKQTGKPLVLVIMAGRQIALQEIIQDTDAILMAWHPGTMAGPALADILLGVSAPSGRLPVTWPKATGQVPIYYNATSTGRPGHSAPFIPLEDVPVEADQTSLGNVSRYIDVGDAPQFPFGFGLGYSSIAYSELSLSAKSLTQGGSLTATAQIKNTGRKDMTEVVQLYIQDVTASVTRPVRELRGFKRIHLQPGEVQRVSFTVTAEDLAFYNKELQWGAEPGAFRLWIAPNAAEGLSAQFELN